MLAPPLSTPPPAWANASGVAPVKKLDFRLRQMRDDQIRRGPSLMLLDESEIPERGDLFHELFLSVAQRR
jgi:hypothetical protein